MGFEVGCSGGFGILIYQEDNAAICKLYAKFKLAFEEAKEKDYGKINGYELIELFKRQWIKRFIAAFAKTGVVIPEGAQLIYTEDDDSRPGRTATPSYEWIIGFGLFMSPFDYPQADESFKKKADWHTWVWGG